MFSDPTSSGRHNGASEIDIETCALHMYCLHLPYFKVFSINRLLLIETVIVNFFFTEDFEMNTVSRKFQQFAKTHSYPISLDFKKNNHIVIHSFGNWHSVEQCCL